MIEFLSIRPSLPEKFVFEIEISQVREDEVGCGEVYKKALHKVAVRGSSSHKGTLRGQRWL